MATSLRRRGGTERARTTTPLTTAPGRSDRRAVALTVAVAVVVVVGVALRFLTSSHLWLDEALTVNIAKLPLSRIPDARLRRRRGRRQRAPAADPLLEHLSDGNGRPDDPRARPAATGPGGAAATRGHGRRRASVRAVAGRLRLSGDAHGDALGRGADVQGRHRHRPLVGRRRR